MKRMKWLLVFIGFCCMISCSTISRSEYFSEQQRTFESLNRMDSLLVTHWQVQQDSSWHEKVTKQLERIYEKNDTSRVVVVDSTGKVIKETVTIIKERNRDNSEETYEREVMMHRLEVMDSTLQVQNEQLIKMDSLLQVSQKSEVIQKEEPWYVRLWKNLQWMLVGAVLVVVLYFTKPLWKKILPF